MRLTIASFPQEFFFLRLRHTHNAEIPYKMIASKRDLGSVNENTNYHCVLNDMRHTINLPILSSYHNHHRWYDISTLHCLRPSPEIPGCKTNKQIQTNSVQYWDLHEQKMNISNFLSDWKKISFKNYAMYKNELIDTRHRRGVINHTERYFVYNISQNTQIQREIN